MPMPPGGRCTSRPGSRAGLGQLGRVVQLAERGVNLIGRHALMVALEAGDRVAPYAGWWAPASCFLKPLSVTT